MTSPVVPVNWNFTQLNNPPSSEGPDALISSPVEWTPETDHLIGTSLTNIDPTTNTHWTTTVGRIDDAYVANEWGTAFSQARHALMAGGAEFTPPSDRGTTGQLWPR